jgi:hypothetical protein
MTIQELPALNETAVEQAIPVKMRDLQEVSDGASFAEPFRRDFWAWRHPLNHCQMRRWP